MDITILYPNTQTLTVYMLHRSISFIMIPFAVLNSLVSDVKMIFACKLSDDFSSFVDTRGTDKRNRAGALVLGNGRIAKDTFYSVLPAMQKTAQQ